MIYRIRKVSFWLNKGPKIIKTRQLKHYDPQKFREDLRKIDWVSILEQVDVNKYMSLDWKKRFLSVLDKHAPFCQRKVRNCHAPYKDKDLRHKMFLPDLHKIVVNMHPKIQMTGRNLKSL